MAILPFLLIRQKSANEFLLTPPEDVAKITYKFSHSSWFSGRDITVVILSSSSKGRRLTIAFPFA